ncbi:MAG: hypothetical protein IT379_04305, partial [Deltaproteobacteria bacterium]|nr:hypothetical protein [Deltaproteobacteria bacterium]
PLPWALRGTVGAGTDALLVEMLAALSGAREGKLAKGTPLPPLVADVESTLDAQGLAPADAPRDVVLDLGAVDPPVSPTVSPSRAEGAWSRRRSATLHRLRLLGIPGFTRKTGPAWATDADLRETWTIVRSTDAPSALIEAGAWGATLEDAARGRLEELLAQSGGHVAKMAEILGEAVFAGLLSFADSVLVSIARAVASEASLGALGGALSRLRALWRHDRVLGSSGSTTIAAVLSAGFDRGCWLLEGIRGKSAPLDETLIAAVSALRDLARDATRGDVAIDSTHLVDICRRTAADPESPPSIRGATMGAMWSLGALGADEEAREHASTQLRAVALPATLGDFLAGLFALAREQIVHAPELVLAVDDVVAAMPAEDFFVAVPSLRLAFSYFPPRERDAIARRVLRHHGGDPDDARRLRRLGTDPATVARALSMEAQADAVLSRYGLGPEPTDAATEEP